MENEVWYKYPEAVNKLPDDIFFITTQELEDMYPELTPEEREDKIASAAANWANIESSSTRIPILESSKRQLSGSYQNKISPFPKKNAMLKPLKIRSDGSLK